jgi:ParB family transcriptional regulator, chromosome partitioning protein
LGLKEIPAIVKELNDKDAFVVAIIENLQRKDLNPIEEADAFKRLLEDEEFSLDELAKYIGKDKTTIANTLRLLKLPNNIKQAVKDGSISRSQAKTILSLEKLQDQENLFRQILNERISVRELEKKVRVISKKKKAVDPFVLEMEEKLHKSLGTKVKLLNKKNNKGKIVIDYYNLNDLERIFKKLK